MVKDADMLMQCVIGYPDLCLGQNTLSLPLLHIGSTSRKLTFGSWGITEHLTALCMLGRCSTKELYPQSLCMFYFETMSLKFS